MLTWVGRSLIVLLTIGLSMLLMLTKQPGLVVSALAIVTSIIVSKINDGLVTIILMIILITNGLIHLLRGPDTIVPWLYVALITVAVLLIELLLSASSETASGDFLVLSSTLFMLGLGQYLILPLPVVTAPNHFAPVLHTTNPAHQPPILSTKSAAVSAAKPLPPQTPTHPNNSQPIPPPSVMPTALPVSTSCRVCDHRIPQRPTTPLALDQWEFFPIQPRIILAPPSLLANLPIPGRDAGTSAKSVTPPHHTTAIITKPAQTVPKPPQHKIATSTHQPPPTSVQASSTVKLALTIPKAAPDALAVIPENKIQQISKKLAPPANDVRRLKTYDPPQNVPLVKVSNDITPTTIVPAQQPAVQQPRGSRPDRVIPLILITIFCLIIV